MSPPNRKGHLEGPPGLLRLQRYLLLLLLMLLLSLWLLLLLLLMLWMS